jgi:hypothetical protein
MASVKDNPWYGQRFQRNAIHGNLIRRLDAYAKLLELAPGEVLNSRFC